MPRVLRRTRQTNAGALSKTAFMCAMRDGRWRHDPCAGTFTLQQVAAKASPLAFEALRRNLEDVSHVALEGRSEEWKRVFEADLARKSENERRTVAARWHIEEMLDLRCPRCSMVFDAFEGSAALRCGRQTCNARSCALCLRDCGDSSDDAHAHLSQCRLNPGNSYYVDVAGHCPHSEATTAEQSLAIA
jgi:hypothetical protein